jgi:tetratricopeptide (TPR) repeat protein
MKVRKFLLLGLILLMVPLLTGLAWFGWRWYSTPSLPSISLEGMEPDKAAMVEQALKEVKRHPRSASTWGELGIVLLANGFMPEAIQCFEHAHRFAPEQPRWPYLHGFVLLLTNPQAGIPWMRKALPLAHSDEEKKAIRFTLALALAEEGELDEADQHLEAFRQLQSGGGDDGSAEVHFGLGLIALGRGDRARARDHLSKVTDHPCARKRACSLLVGLCQGDAKLADKYRERAALLPDDQPWPNPFDADIRKYRPDPHQEGPLAPYFQLVAAGQHAEALAFLRRFVQETPNNEGACFTLGFALFSQGDYEEAERAMRQTLHINKRNVKAHLFLGGILLERGEKRLLEPDGKQHAQELFRQAIAAEDRALALQGDLVFAHIFRGRALAKLGRPKEALAEFREAVVLGPDSADAHQALGEALAESGNMREAIEQLELAVRLAKPQNQRPRKALEKWRGGSGKKPPPSDER